MVILKDGDTHKSQGAGKDTSPHHPPSAQVLETVIPLLLEPQNSRISGTGKGSFPVSQIDFLLELKEASDTIKLGKFWKGNHICLSRNHLRVGPKISETQKLQEGKSQGNLWFYGSDQLNW